MTSPARRRAGRAQILSKAAGECAPPALTSKSCAKLQCSIAVDSASLDSALHGKRHRPPQPGADALFNLPDERRPDRTAAASCGRGAEHATGPVGAVFPPDHGPPCARDAGDDLALPAVASPAEL